MTKETRSWNGGEEEREGSELTKKKDNMIKAANNKLS